VDRGLRHNEGKLRYDLVPEFAQSEYVKVLTMGAKKYSDGNWKLGMKWSKVIASLKRHLAAIERCEDTDQESLCLHSAHIMCNAAFLTEYYHIYPQGDDRVQWYKKPLKRVYLDIDGVIADFEQHFLKYTNNELTPPTDWNDYRFRNDFHKVNEDDFFWLSIPKIIEPSEMTYPIQGYVTSRPIGNDVIEAWLKNMGFPKCELINVPHGEKKSAVLKDKCDVFIDDSIYNFMDCQSNGITCYLMTRPHNAKYDVGHYRMSNFKEFMDLIKS